MVIGHEFVGVVERVGDHVKGFATGDLVAGEGHITCGHCRNCLAGPAPSLPEHAGRGRESPGRVGGIRRDSAWTTAGTPIRSIPLDVLSCFDPLGNAVHTALSFDLVGEDVLITGAGPIGCMAVPICKHAGARNVVITDINPYRLDLAQKMGADVSRSMCAPKTLPTRCKKLGMKEGFDVALEMSGSPKAFD